MYRSIRKALVGLIKPTMEEVCRNFSDIHHVSMETARFVFTEAWCEGVIEKRYARSHGDIYVALVDEE